VIYVPEQVYVTETAEAVGMYGREDVDRAPGIVDEFGERVAKLAATIRELTDRLGPVLKPDYDAEKQRAEQVAVPVTSAIRSVHAALVDETMRLRVLIDRLEV
jgi:hypothetical protein